MRPATTGEPLYYGWVIVALAFMMQTLSNGSTQAIYGVMAVPLSETFGVSRSQIMLFTASAALIGSGMISPLVGIWLQRYSNKRLILFGCTVLAFGYLALSQANALWQVAVLYFTCWSLGITLFGTLAASTAVSNWFVEKRGRALGFATIGLSAGTFLFPPAVSWIIVHYGWRQACLVLSTLLLLSTPVILRWFRDKPQQAPVATDDQPHRPSIPPLRASQIFANRNFWTISICTSIAFAGFNGLTTNLVPMAVELGVGQQRGALLMSISALCAICGKLTVGFFIDRLGAQRALVFPLIILCVACLTLTGSPDFTRMATGAALLGLSSGGAIPVWGAMIASFFDRDSFSLVMGLMNPLLMPLIVIAAPLVSFTQERLGHYDPALYVIIGCAVVAIGLSRLLKKPGD